MKAFLMHKDYNFDLQRKLPANEQTLVQDLELNTLFSAMALGDEFLFEVAKKAVLSGSNDLDTILYRQNILKDCLKNPFIIRDIYDIAVESIDRERKHWSLFNKYPSWILHRSTDVLTMFLDMLKKLQNIAAEHADRFNSEGLAVLFAILKKELDDEYFTRVQDHLRELKFDGGVLISAKLGKGNKGSNYTLHKRQDRKPPERKRSWLQRIFAPKRPLTPLRLVNAMKAAQGLCRN